MERFKWLHIAEGSGLLKSAWIDTVVRAVHKGKVTPVVLKTYPPGEWVSASPTMLRKGYGICVFASEKTALSFYDNSLEPTIEGARQEAKPNSYSLWLVETEDEIQPPRWQMSFADFFRYSPKRHFIETYMKWPWGTIMAKRVKLLTEVQVEVPRW